MNAIDHACQFDDAKLVALKAAPKAPTAVQYKALTRSAIQALDLSTYYEKIGLVGDIEDAWVQLEAD